MPSCAEGGVLGAICATIASIQVTEVLKLLTGVGTPLVGRLLMYEALDATYHQIRIAKNPDCAICGDA
ncbi:molybdopterin biosynthesis-like protein MoeZ, partial [Mycobacterium tuberculosis]